MPFLVEIVSWICIIAGCFFSLVGAVGVLRLPDVFSRMHGAGMVDTGGASLILIGLMFQSGFTFVTVKLFLIILFLLYTSPGTTHALARAALGGGEKPWTPEPLDNPENQKVGDGEPSKT